LKTKTLKLSKKEFLILVTLCQSILLIFNGKKEKVQLFALFFIKKQKKERGKNMKVLTIQSHELDY